MEALKVMVVNAFMVSSFLDAEMQHKRDCCEGVQRGLLKKPLYCLMKKDKEKFSNRCRWKPRLRNRSWRDWTTKSMSDN